MLQPYVKTPVLALSEALNPGRVGYAVLYIDQLQRGNEPDATAMLLNTLKPVHTVQVHGIDYAWIYQIPRPVTYSVAADFGSKLSLRGYDVERASGSKSSLRNDDVERTDVTKQRELALTVHWQTSEAMASDYMLFVHVLDAAGNLIGQTDVPPAGGGTPTSAWQPGHYTSADLRIPLTVDRLPPAYWITLGVYDPQSGDRLVLQADPPRQGAPNDGPNALRLGPLP